MKENDYYGHYKAFVKELSRKPDQTLQFYCQENGVIWRRLYDWMRRHHISLKRLYHTYRMEWKGNATATGIHGDIDFRELIPVKSMAVGTALPGNTSSGKASSTCRLNKSICYNPPIPGEEWADEFNDVRLEV